jgi:hypothetical protein
MCSEVTAKLWSRVRGGRRSTEIPLRVFHILHMKASFVCIVTTLMMLARARYSIVDVTIGGGFHDLIVIQAPTSYT